MTIPYGYKVIDGIVVVDEEAAEKVRALYREYLSGKSYKEAIAAAGLSLTHSSAKHMMQNRKYLGNVVYPAIIDKQTFLEAEFERVTRQGKLGRFFEPKPEEGSPLATRFSMRKPDKEYDDPFEQAAYIYSLIESEVER